MTDRDRPLEESPEMAAAADDETTVPQLVTGGGPDAETPHFTGPGAPTGDFPPTDEIIGNAEGGGSTEPGRSIRTGVEQPWEPEDLAAARGQDPTPANVERARQDLAREGRSAVEKTVP